MAKVLKESTKGSAAMNNANAASNGSLRGIHTMETSEMVKTLVVPVDAKAAKTEAKTMKM
jgi:hypothetical protein